MPFKKHASLISFSFSVKCNSPNLGWKFCQSFLGKSGDWTGDTLYSVLQSTGGTGSESQVTVPGSADSVDIMNINEGSYKFEVVAQAQHSSGKVFQSDRSPPVVIKLHTSICIEGSVSPNAASK